MPKIEAKQVVVDEIKEKLGKAKSVVLVSSRGLTVAQDTALRNELRKASVDYKVYKNTMMHFAIQGTPFEGLGDFLAGPTAVAISYEDSTAPARVINAQLKNMPKLEFKAGVIENAVYNAEGMKAVADIPSREVLISKLLGSFKSPMASFARVINAVAEKNGEPAGAGETA